MKGEFLSIETAEELAKLRKENEKLENDKRDMLLELYKTNGKIDKAIEYLEYQISQLDLEKDTKAKMLGSMALVLLQGSDE